MSTQPEEPDRAPTDRQPVPPIGDSEPTHALIYDMQGYMLSVTVLEAHKVDITAELTPDKTFDLVKDGPYEIHLGIMALLDSLGAGESTKELLSHVYWNKVTKVIAAQLIRLAILPNESSSEPTDPSEESEIK